MPSTRPTTRATTIADVLLADGVIAEIRPLVPEDRDALLALHDQVADRSLRLRFFSTNRAAGHDYVEHLLANTDTTLALIALVREQIVGVATAERFDPGTAEVAFLVADSMHGHGVGSLLLEHLAAACRNEGVRRLVAEVLTENDAMLGVFREAGLQATFRQDQGIVDVEMGTSETLEALSVSDTRDFKAEARSLASLLYPRSVAVVGVRSHGGGIGVEVLRSILRGGFTGALSVVHPTATSIEGVACHADLASVPAPLDLVVVAVPAQRVLEVVEDAAAAGAKAAVVITSGFSELGLDGARLQRDIVRVAREHSLRLVGPNCLGVLSNDPGVRLNATFATAAPPSGGLAIASQSGGVGIAVLDIARELDLGIHSFISLGNKADVSGNDLLGAWYDDDRVTAVALYLESFGNALKFARVARRFAERKPVLAVVGGRSAGGVRAGASHTAAAAAPTVGVDALFTQAGVIRCGSAEEMARTALLLQQQPLPGGRRVAIVSNAGGVGVLAADAADVRGVHVPELSATVQSQLGEVISSTAGTSNPVDLGAGAGATHLAAVLDSLLSSGEVDAVVVALVATSVTDPVSLAAALREARARHADTPLVVVAMGGLKLPREPHDGLTVFRSADEAIAALTLAMGYAEWLGRPREGAPARDEDRALRSRTYARDVLARDSADDLWLPASDGKALLAPYDLEPVGAVTETPDGAAELASTLGFPVVVKVADPDVIHKTDRGLVRVGLNSPEAVVAAVQSFASELGHEEVPVLVQPVVSGVEVALGVVRDPGFGPLVMVAAGGIATQVLDDRAFLLAPVTRQDAGRALRSLRSWPLLEGYRGSPPVDVEALEELICSLGELARDVPEVSELDLNPVIATPTGAVLVDVKIRLTETAITSWSVPRQLRAVRG